MTIKKILLSIISVGALFTMPVMVKAMDRAAIVPQPAEYTISDGSLSLPDIISVKGDFVDDAIKYLSFNGLDSKNANKNAFLTIRRDSILDPGAYTLDVTPNGVMITASDQAGVMYAVATLSQIIAQTSDGLIQSCSITDYTRMQYRGMMLDVVRCYMPVEEVKKFIDVAASLKLNKFHMHLTDDNGWRIEIKKYPKLTDVGAWRVDRKELFPARRNPTADEKATYGGYYTQDQLRDLVSYAAERNVEIIPEIEMPAHAIAAIASYPELTCPVNDEFIGVLPGIGGKAASIIMCAGNDNTISFVKDVLDEVMDIFPSEHIHLGGDEANKARWEKCPRCNDRIKHEHLDGYEALQGWFMDQIISYVNSKGRKAIGWDEVTYGNPKEDIVIMGWQGTGAVAEKYAADTGRRFIMTPARSTYLIRYQGPQWFEPFTYFGNITLKDVYEYDPVKPEWTDAMCSQLWGIQGSMWTEFCRTPSDVQYMVFPRLIALADAAWRQPGTGDWPTFIKATDAFLPRLQTAGINYAKSMYNIQHQALPNGDGSVTISAECIRPDAEILYTPGLNAPAVSVYQGPLTINADDIIAMYAQTPDGHTGQVLALDVKFNKATGKKIMADSCTNSLAPVLLNGLRGSLRNSDFEWSGWHNSQAQFIVDLGSVQHITKVMLGALGNANVCVALPKRVSLYGATDDGAFGLLGKVEIDTESAFPLDAAVTDFAFNDLDTNARYIKIVADNPGRVPDGYPREDCATWLYFDELIVE